MPKPKTKIIFLPGGMSLAVSDVQLDVVQNNITPVSASSPDVLPNQQSPSPFSMYTGRNARANASSSTEEKSDREKVKESTPAPAPISVSQQVRRPDQILPPKSICKRRTNVPMSSDDDVAAEELYREDCSGAAGSSFRTLTLREDLGGSVRTQNGPNSGDKNTARNVKDERRRQASTSEDDHAPMNPNHDTVEGLYYEDRSRAASSSLRPAILVDDFGRYVATHSALEINPRTVLGNPGASADKTNARDVKGDGPRQSSTSGDESGLRSLGGRNANVAMNPEAEGLYYEDRSVAANNSLRTDDLGRLVRTQNAPKMNAKTVLGNPGASADKNSAINATYERRRQGSTSGDESGLRTLGGRNASLTVNPDDNTEEGLYYEDRSGTANNSLRIDDSGRPVGTQNSLKLNLKTVLGNLGATADENSARNATHERQRQGSTSGDESGLRSLGSRNASIATTLDNDTAEGSYYEDRSGAAGSSVRTDDLGRPVRAHNRPKINPQTVSGISAGKNTASNATGERRTQDESSLPAPRRDNAVVTQGHDLVARFREKTRRPGWNSASAVGNKNQNSHRNFQNTRSEQNSSSSFEDDTQAEMTSRQKSSRDVNEESSPNQINSDNWPINSATAKSNDDEGSDWEVESYSSHHPSNYLKYTGNMMPGRHANVGNFRARHKEIRPKNSEKPQSTVQSRIQQGESNGMSPIRPFQTNINRNGESNNHPLAGTSQRNSVTPKVPVESVSDYSEEDESTSFYSTSESPQNSVVSNDFIQKSKNDNNYSEPITANSSQKEHFNCNLLKSDAGFAQSNGFSSIIASSSTPKFSLERPKQDSPSTKIHEEVNTTTCQKSANEKFDEESCRSEESDSTGKSTASTRKTVNYRAAMFSRILREREAKNTNEEDLKTTIIFDASISQEESSLEQEDEPEFCICSIGSNCNKWCTCPAWRAKNLKFGPAASPSDLFLLKKPRPKDSEENGAVPKVVEIDKKIVQNTLFHGTVIPKPAKTTADISFDDRIRKKLEKLKCAHPTVIQAHMWPACLRRMNMCMVGGKRTGKTLAYLPALCTFMVARKEFYRDLAEYEGPLIVVLCNTPSKAIKLFAAVDTLLENVGEDDKPGVEVVTQSGGARDDLNKYDILITTPALLENCLRERQLSLKRLCHLVIENADVVLRESPRLMENLFSVVDEIQNKRPHYIRIQVIAVSETWSANLENLCTHLQSPPLICVSDALEAAFYSRIQFSRKMLKTEFKMFYLEDLLTGKFSDNRTVVFCDESEIPDLRERLTLKGIDSLTITSKMSHEDVVENHDSWTRLRCGQFRVLLCSDEGFKRLKKVGPASWLVHYRLPEKWLTFVSRFQCLIENFKNSPYDTEKQAIFCHSFVVIEGESHVSERFFEVLAKNIVGNFLVTKTDEM